MTCLSVLEVGQAGDGTAIEDASLNSSLSGYPAPASASDLTNAGSPEAAAFNGSQSATSLSRPSGPFKPNVGLRLVAEGFTAPMTVASPDDGSGRLFIVDMPGTIKVLDSNGTLHDEPFLDVRNKTVKLIPSYNERGLLGLAFHPDFRQSGRVFIYYSVPLRQGGPAGWNHTNRLSEFNVSRDDPYRVDMSSERVLMEIDMPYLNHNGGQICFGTDGYLYIPVGDGGRADDTGPGHTPGTGNAQDLTNPLGKILRIDVDHPANGKPYGIPSDNPSFGNSSALPEIYAYGFRNPATASIDSKSGRLIVGDAGQELFEEADLVLKGGNYGWNLREGTHCFDSNRPKQPSLSCRTSGYRGEPLIGPIVELGHDIGQVIVGGFMYRGLALPDFQGRYIFGDWSSYDPLDNGTLLVATPPPGWDGNISSADDLTPSDVQMWPTEAIRVTTSASGRINAYVRGFGEDADHELYVVTSDIGELTGTTGKVYKIVPAGNASGLI
ncbi:MAG TPA: PQQ-dependent sugar dehydrogenase [Methanotrichaceae archaeon]|nr:PQQ-dependent sugar dehydrogenase [Methanotrichaceae archaeon]